MKQIIEVYNMIVSRIEDFMYRYILPPLFRVMIFGMKLTLIWAFYQTIKNSVKELF